MIILNRGFSFSFTCDQRLKFYCVKMYCTVWNGMHERCVSLLVDYHLSFPVLHKVGIFLQLLMEINWKWLPVE